MTGSSSIIGVLRCHWPVKPPGGGPGAPGSQQSAARGPSLYCVWPGRRLAEGQSGYYPRARCLGQPASASACQSLSVKVALNAVAEFMPQDIVIGALPDDDGARLLVPEGTGL